MGKKINRLISGVTCLCMAASMVGCASDGADDPADGNNYA